MKSRFYQFKVKAISLRSSGRTYGEIIDILDQPIPKSTLAEWFKNVTLSKDQQRRVEKKINNNIQKARSIALKINKKRRDQYLESVTRRVEHLRELTTNKDVAKIIIAMLYWGEGSKTDKGAITLGGSDPRLIRSFLSLLRYCYNINEDRFRCTLQCRADQDTEDLERFWSKVTKIPRKQFYKARIDSRTIGKRSRKIDYKGVCRIDYFSADVFNEIMKIIEVVSMGL